MSVIEVTHGKPRCILFTTNIDIHSQFYIYAMTHICVETIRYQRTCKRVDPC